MHIKKKKERHLLGLTSQKLRKESDGKKTL